MSTLYFRVLAQNRCSDLTQVQDETEHDPNTPSANLSPSTKGGPRDEFAVGADAGSPKLQDRVRHDAPGFALSTGFLGKASAVRLVEEVSEKV